MRWAPILAAGLLAVTTAASSEVLPQPGLSNPRIQTVSYTPGETVLLTLLPRSSLTVMLEPGESIRQVISSDETGWRVAVSSEQDSLQIAPPETGTPGAMQVATDRRVYRFGMRVDSGLTAAYLVQFKFNELPPAGSSAPLPPAAPANEQTTRQWRLAGDREVRPQSVSDDGLKTTIAYGPDQALPAVMAIGPTGEEEVVNGYMRGDAFVIDRVYEDLVFRIDKKRATARRAK